MGKFRDLIENFELETNKNQLKKLGNIGIKVIELGKKYKVNDVFLDRKSLSFNDVPKDNVKDLKKDLHDLFKDEEINAIIKIPSLGKINIVVDMSEPRKMQVN